MLPEQVWDYADMPAEGLYFGRSAGSAQPLVWAHAEYVKLLRSVADASVFDRITVVEERYAVPKDERKFTSRMEIFQLARPISAMVQGKASIPHHRRAALPDHMDRRRLGDHYPYRIHRLRPPGIIRRHLHLAADDCHPHLHALLAWSGPLARTQRRSFHQRNHSPNHARRSQAEVVALRDLSYRCHPRAEDLLLPLPALIVVGKEPFHAQEKTSPACDNRRDAHRQREDHRRSHHTRNHRKPRKPVRPLQKLPVMLLR